MTNVHKTDCVTMRFMPPMRFEHMAFCLRNKRSTPELRRLGSQSDQPFSIPKRAPISHTPYIGAIALNLGDR